MTSNINKGKLKAYTDGACSNNGGYLIGKPIIGKFGYVIVDQKEIIVKEKVGTVMKDPTNNKMELRALTTLMEYLSNIEFDRCTIYTDSQYCIWGFRQGENIFLKKGAKNVDEWKRALAAYNQVINKVIIEWIKGHQEKNNWNDYIDDKLRDKKRKPKTSK